MIFILFSYASVCIDMKTSSMFIFELKYSTKYMLNIGNLCSTIIKHEREIKLGEIRLYLAVH